jgi:hypothetical protein
MKGLQTKRFAFSRQPTDSPLPARETTPNSKPLSFIEFVSRVNPKFLWHPHCVALAAVLQRVADDELKRVIN